MDGIRGGKRLLYSHVDDPLNDEDDDEEEDEDCVLNAFPQFLDTPKFSYATF